MRQHVRSLIVLTSLFFVNGCAAVPETITPIESTLSLPTQIQIATPTSSMTVTPTPAPGSEVHDCSTIEQLPADLAQAQQILEEFIDNFKEQYPNEYMGMAILHRVDRLGEWAVVQGSVSGEAKDVIAVHQTPQGYQIAERYIITAPLELFDEPEKLVPEYFLERLPEAPGALFTCLDPSWLLAVGYPSEPSGVYQLAYIGTDDFTTQGVTEIHTLLSDGSNQTVCSHEAMLIRGLTSSPDGEQLAFWGCLGSLANDGLPDEDMDVWAVNWDGSNLVNLTKDSKQDDSHPDWSPDGKQIVFDSRRSGKVQIYVMRADGSNVRQVTGAEGDKLEPNGLQMGNGLLTTAG